MKGKKQEQMYKNQNTLFNVELKIILYQANARPGIKYRKKCILVI